MRRDRRTASRLRDSIALASLRGGEVVLDLGSGGGLNCFMTANKVGPKGKVIGADMIPEMIDRARSKTL